MQDEYGTPLDNQLNAPEATTDTSAPHDTGDFPSSFNTDNTEITKRIAMHYHAALEESSVTSNSTTAALKYALLRYLTPLEPAMDMAYVALVEQLVQAMELGHSCMLIQDSEALSRYSTIGSGAHATPLVLTHQRLMLYRYFMYEARLLDALRALAKESEESKQTTNFKPRENLNTQQNQAVKHALSQRVLLLSGGPGTGKTTTLSEIVCALDQGHDTPCTVHITAPTGKASAQLLASLQDKPLSKTTLQSATLHRLLGYNPITQRYGHHAANKLNGDIFILDEASMVPVELFSHFVSALPAHAQLIITGDAKQLPAIDVGAVFCDLIRLVEREQLAMAHVTLTTNYRFADSHGIAQFAGLMETANKHTTEIPEPKTDTSTPQQQSLFADDWDAAPFESHDALETQLSEILSRDGITWIDTAEQPNQHALSQIHQHATTHYAKYLEVVQAHATGKGSVADCFAAFDAFRVLCAVNNGAWGVRVLNDVIERQLFSASNPRAANTSAFYHGRPIMVLQNDYALQLFNGDIGLVLRNDAGELMAYFPSMTQASNDSDTQKTSAPYRSIALPLLPQHDTCFAMSIHKSQGSEMAHVMLVLPEDSGILSQALLYTGVTRAKVQLTLAASLRTLRACLEQDTVRHSYLRALAENAKS